MNDVFRAAAELQEFCERQHWRFCFIGGIALQRWADPRQTVDADLTLVTGFGEEQTFVDSLLSAFRPRTEGEREDAIHRRVALLFSSEEIALGVALGTLPFEENSVQRASRWQLDDRHSLITCSADDLIVHKAFAARDLDWADVRSIVLRQGRKLNVDQIWSELRPLSAAKEEPEILTKLQRIFDEALD